MLAWRLLLATGEPAYADLAERTLYNVVAASSGRRRYRLLLHQHAAPAGHRDRRRTATPSCPVRPVSLRAPWFEVSCCPPNVARTLASLAAYLATKDESGIQLHQYAACRINTTLDDGRPVRLEIETDYPHRGSVRIRSVGPAIGPWTLALRVPAWAHGATITDRLGTRPAEPGTAAVTDGFEPGTTVVLDLPMAPRLSFPDPRIDAVRDAVAVERGPLVLCAESTDLPGGSDVGDLLLDTTGELIDTAPAGPGTVQPWVTAAGRITSTLDEFWPYQGESRARTGPGQSVGIRLIPYHQWANRGPSTMRVWIPTVPDAATPPKP